MNDLRIFLSNFLNTINYPESKEDFINKFLSAIYLETIDELIKTLPQDKQALISQKLESAKTPEFLQQVVNNNFDQNLFNKTLQKTSERLFREYLETINETLTDEQKDKLQEYFASFKPKEE